MNSEMLLFSIVIPTYNRPDRLKSCLQALSQLDYPRDRFEVIAVDDGSSIALNSVVEPFQSQLQLTLWRQENAGPAAARNAGAAMAKGQFLVFTDDDCMPATNWLTALSDRLATSPQSLIGGQTLNALPDNVCSTASQLLIDYLYEYYNANSDRAHFFASNNFAMPTAAFRAIGGFDTTFPLAAGEDREFCDRWLHAGYTMAYAPEVQIYHAHHLTLKSFWKQHFNYGRGAFCFHQLRAQRGQQRLQVEPLSFYFNLLTYPFVRSSSYLSTWRLAVLLFISQVANIAGFFWQQKQRPANEFAATQTKSACAD
ncbi:MAG: glycosyltransferase [Cyanosarcina radialis HA8281-LM2]|jgi:GT2 family glycosyltransferase|nr:glycosyltransferase [Cyanosarcina radialis HA8281-LM2]